MNSRKQMTIEDLIKMKNHLDSLPLPKYDGTFQDFYKTTKEKEDEFVKKIASEYLKREVTIEDAKDFSKVIITGLDYKYVLMYKEVKIGLVEYCYGREFIHPLGIQFTPYELS